ncbi:MAG: M28 family peptidase [Acidobacteria bacterium]|nr:M28 family peptidase [Acidobacteriota bacterium]
MLVAALLSGTASGRGQAAASAAAALSDAERAAAALVSVETIREATAALSAKEMEGRGTGQPGGERAAQYIAERFSKLGLKPAGEKNSFFQTMKFREFGVTPESFFKADDETLKPGDDYYVTPPHSGDEDVSGRLVFVGYGVVNKARDDFKGIDVRGKVVVLVSGPPPGVTEAQWKKLDAPFLITRNIVSGGAAAIVFANMGTEQTPYPDRGEFVSQELKRAAKIKVRFRDAKVSASNVAALLEGADAKLKEEAVVYTAHYDAWGVGADGRVFPGAADNALGVAEMLAIAEALAKSPAPPRRSVIFLAVTGEEYGLHGAEYWTKRPTWKIKQVAANLNFDGMGTEVYGPLKKVVGFGAEHSDLGATLASVAAAAGVEIVPDPMPEEKSFIRSDHYAFVKRGVPALMLLGGPDITKDELLARVKDYEKTRYHLPGDVIQAGWDWEGARGVARLGVVLGLRVANADRMPAWLKSSPYDRERGTDKPLPEEK